MSFLPSSRQHPLAPALLLPFLLNSGTAHAQTETKLLSGFETEKDRAGWTVSGTATVADGTAHAGKSSLTITRDKTTDDVKWTSGRFAVRPGEPYRFSAWMKSEKIFMPDPSFAPEVHVVFHNAVFADVGEVSFADYWKVPRDAGAVGLKDFSFDWRYFEKVILPPPSAIGARIEFKFNKTTGTAWMDDVQVTYEPNAVVEGVRAKSAFLKLWPARAGQNGSMRSAGGTLFNPGEPLEYLVKAPDGAPAEGGMLTWKIKDALQRTLATGTVPASGAIPKVTLPNQDAQTGRWLQCDWTWKQGEKVLAQRTTSLLILPAATPPTPGVFGSYGNPGDYELLKKLGMTVMRSDVFWRDDNQPSPDKPIDWKGLLAQRMDMPSQFGLPNLALFSWQAPKWAWLRPDGFHDPNGYAIKPEALRQAAFETASRYKGKVQYWQLGNEVNVHDPQLRKDYIADFIAFSAGIKAADPDAKVVLGSQNRSLEDIQAALSEGALPAMDILDYHYADTGLLRAIRAYLNKVSPNKHIPIWETELGFFTQDTDDIFATNFLTIMTGAAGEGVENAIWCYFGGVPFVSELEESSPTLTRGTYLTEQTRQPSQLLAQHILLADYIQGAKPVRALEWGRVKGYLFRRGTRNSAVIWAEGLEPISGALSLPARQLQISDWTGRRRTLNIDGSLPFIANRRPWLVSWDGPEPGDALSFNPAGPLQVKTQRSRVLYKGTPNTVTFTLAAGATPQTVSLDAGSEAKITPAQFTLKPGESREVQVEVPAETDAERLTLDASLSSNKTEGWAAWEYNLRPALTVSLEAAPRSNAVGAKNQAGWRVRVANNGNQDATASVSLASYATATARPEHAERTVQLLHGQTADVLFPLPLVPSFDQKYAAETQVKVGWQHVDAATESGFLGVARAKKPPVIDGDLRDWKDTEPALLNSPAEYWRYTDQKPWGGPGDLSARLFFRWDPAALYFAADVSDDIQVNDQDPGNIWNGDSVELGLQAYDEINRAPIEKVILATVRGKTNVMLSLEGRRTTQEDVQAAVVRGNGHTYYEARVPWAILSPLTAGSPGLHIRGAVMLNEDDGQGRAAYMNWFGRLTYPTKGEGLFTDLTMMP